ncbi:MAG: right-handed parallel beta-helix repeat-containing protein [Myxococcota bacterium]
MVRRRAATLGAAVSLALAVAGPARAGFIAVDSFTDDPADTTSCTLRDAMMAADLDAEVDGCNAGQGADFIGLSVGTYEVGAVIPLSSEVTIFGSNLGPTVVRGNGSGLFEVTTTGTLDINRLTLRDAAGPAILTEGSLVVREVLFDSNANPVDGGGVVVRATGTAQFTDCEFRDNRAGLNGGGAAAIRGQATFDACRFVDNQGASSGGAILLLDNDPRVTIRDSYFAGNHSPGSGGAIYTFGNASSELTISNTTFYDNEAVSGGAVYFNGVSNGTIDHCTFVDNTALFGGGGAFRFATGSVTILNSLLARNTAPFAPGREACDNLPAAGSNNVVEGGCSLNGSGNQIGVTAQAGLPGDFGGPFPTIPVGFGSPAIGASDCLDGQGDPVLVDQRGEARPAQGCTAGSYENDLPELLLRTETEPAGANCPTGGVAIQAGFDSNLDGTLDAGEVTSTDYVCGSGTASPPVVSTTPEAPGAICPAGGQTVAFGYDDDGSGMLEPGEIVSSFVLCNGGTGSDGLDGREPLVEVTDEPSGGNCASGGLRVDVGIDDGSGNGVARNGTLEPGEITATEYVCNGADGTNGVDGADGSDGASPIVQVETEPAGENCETGGARILTGFDDGEGGETADDGVLGEGEIDATSFLCNGADGSDGIDGSPGEAGGCSVTGSGPSSVALSLGLFAMLFRRRGPWAQALGSGHGKG